MTGSKRDNICDLNLGSVDQIFLLTEPSILETKSGSLYLRCTLSDKTGSLDAIRWDTDHAPDPGLYHLRGLVEDYRGKHQIKITGDLIHAEDDLSRYIRCSEFTEARLLLRLEQYLKNLDGEVGDVTRAVFDIETKEAFLKVPAATKNHHAFRGGLAEHTMSMVELAYQCANHYQDLYGAHSIDRDLLIAGTLLHDLGKIYELQEDGFTWSRGVRGELVGHMAEVTALIHDACMACLASQDTRDRLLHMVLSHHGKNEWGSPVEPRCVEAMLLHQIDMMDSRFAMFREATDGLEPGEMSDRVWALGGRVIR